MTNSGALSLTLFIIAQAVGIGILASGSYAGLIAILMSAGSGYYGIRWLRERLRND